MQKQRLSALMNQAVMALFGIMFCFLGVKKDLHEQAGCLFFVSGLLLLVVGIFRTWLIGKLMKKVDFEKDSF